MISYMKTWMQSKSAYHQFFDWIASTANQVMDFMIWTIIYSFFALLYAAVAYGLYKAGLIGVVIFLLITIIYQLARRR